MSFFFADTQEDYKKRVSKGKSKKLSDSKLMELGCNACPLNRQKRNAVNPQIESQGVDDPSIFIISPPTNSNLDRRNKVIEQSQKRRIDNLLGRSYENKIRIIPAARCPTPNDRPHTREEIVCCRKHVNEEIEKYKPKVVVGVGQSSLYPMESIINIITYRGRIISSKFNFHSCYFVPVEDFYMYESKKMGMKEKQVINKKDWDLVKKLSRRKTVPVVYSDNYDDGVEIITGNNGKRDYEKLVRILNELKSTPVIAIDVETATLRPYSKESEIVTCAVGTFEKVISFSVDHREGWNIQWRPKVRELLFDFIMNSKLKIAHALGFEFEWLVQYYDWKAMNKCQWGDTKAQAFVIDERIGALSLDSLCAQYFGFGLKSKTEINLKNIYANDLNDLLKYNGMDSKWTAKLYYEQMNILTASPELTKEYYRQNKTTKTLVAMQNLGVDVSQKTVNKFLFEFGDRREKIINEIYYSKQVKKFEKQYGRFDLSNEKVLSKFFNDFLQVNIKNKKGKDSFSEDSYNRIKGVKGKIPKLMIEEKKLTKVLSTYVEPLCKDRDGKQLHDDGKIHTNFNNFVTSTGRLSSSDPNLQNYPKRKFKEVRSVIKPYKGLLAAVDYAAIEARVIAMLSRDENLVKAFWDDYDIHAAWSVIIQEVDSGWSERVAEEFNIALTDSKIAPVLRQEAKNKWVFPQFYGSRVDSCAKSMNITERRMKKVGDLFWDEFGDVKKWQEKELKNYNKYGYVTTLGGRRRRGPLKENEIINSASQGSASDLVVDAMNRITELAYEIDNLEFVPRINIHDDLTFFLLKDKLKRKIRKIAKLMVDFDYDYINVPLEVEIEVGKNWGELKKYGVFNSRDKKLVVF